MIITREQYLEALECHGVPPGNEVEWKDRDGHVWKVTEMAGDHLENAMAFMVRNAYSIHFNECWRMAGMGDDPIIGPHGDAANDAFDQEFNYLMDMDPEVYITTMYPPYLAMRLELVKREKELQEFIHKTQDVIPDWLR